MLPAKFILDGLRARGGVSYGMRSSIIKSNILVRDMFTTHCTNSFLSENEWFNLGFRSRHSIETALTKITEDLPFNLDNDCVSGMVLIDYRKAFDMINHTHKETCWNRWMDSVQQTTN